MAAIVVALGMAAGVMSMGPANAETGPESTPQTSVEPASKKKGPPPGATTKQIQNWVTDALTKFNSSCRSDAAYPCTLTIDWSNIRWMGTTRICIEGLFGQPCMKYGTAYVARTSIMVTTATQMFDYQNNPTYISTEKSRYGYWDGGRQEVEYQPWPGGPTWKASCADCGKDLYVRKGKFGRWFWGFGNTAYYLR